MNDGYAWWLVLVGIAVGLGLTWLVMGRIPRDEDDVDPMERELEADWVSRTIEARGGVCPQPLAAEVLALHHEYLMSSGATIPAPVRSDSGTRPPMAGEPTGPGGGASGAGPVGPATEHYAG